MVKNDQEGISSREIRMNRSTRKRDFVHSTGKHKSVEMTEYSRMGQEAKKVITVGLGKV